MLILFLTEAIHRKKWLPSEPIVNNALVHGKDIHISIRDKHMKWYLLKASLYNMVILCQYPYYTLPYILKSSYLPSLDHFLNKSFWI